MKEFVIKIFFSPGVSKSIYKNGSFHRNDKDDYIEKNKKNHSQDLVFNEAYWSEQYINRIDSVTSEIKTIINLCNKNNIEFVFDVKENVKLMPQLKKAV